MAKLEDQKQPDVTPDNMLEHPATPPDMLHSFVQSKTNTPDPDEESRDSIKAALKHPNVSGDTIKHVYNHFFPKQDDTPANGDDTNVEGNTDMLEGVMSHPNTPSEVAQDYLKRTYKLKDWQVNRVAQEASEHKGIPEEFKQGLLHDVLSDPSLDENHPSVRGYNLHPESYFKLLEDRPSPEPETPRMTEEQKKTNLYVKKIDKAVLHGLSSSTQHDKQSATKALSFFTTKKPPYGMDVEKRTEALHSFVQNQKSIPADSLTELSGLKKPDGKDDWAMRLNIVNHPNVDSATVAKIAMSTPSKANTGDDDNKWNAEEAISAAIASPKLPDQTRKSMIGAVKPSDPEDTNKVLSLMQNPKTTKDEIVHLYRKGFQDTVIKDSRLPEELINQYAEDEGSQTGGARKLLERDKLPESTLLSLVGHKNLNVAKDALSHKDASMAVINAGLKRKSKEVQLAASRHPLVAKQVMRDRLNSGQMDASDLLFNAENRKAFGDIKPEDVAVINKQHSLQTPEQFHEKDNDDKFWRVKGWLATSNEASPEVKEANRKDIVNHFLRSTDPSTMLPRFEDTSENSNIGVKLGQAVSNLADSYGDENAKKAALNRPYLLHDLDLKKPSYDENYIRSAYSKIGEYEKQGLNPREGFRNHEGGDLFFKEQKVNLGRNESTPEDIFTDIITKPDYLSSHSNYSLARSDEGDSTVFDKRWGNLPDQVKRERFSRLQGVGSPDSHYAVVTSKKVPADIWRNSFNALSDQQKEKFANEHDVSEHMDPQTKLDTLGGGYYKDHVVTSTTGRQFDPIEQVLRSLDPAKADDHQALQHFLDTNVYATPEEARISNSDIVDSVDRKFFDGEQGTQRLWGVLRNDRGLGARLADKVVSGDEDRSYSEPYDVNKLRSLMDVGLDGMTPEEANTIRNERWQAALEQKADGYSFRRSGRAGTILDKYIEDERDPNGSMDFLMDLPGDNGFVTTKQQALNSGLISHDRVAKESAADPEQLETILKGSDAYQASKRIQSLVDSPSLDDATLDVIASSLFPHSFTARQSGRAAMTDAEFAKARDYTSKFIDHAMRSNERIPIIAKGISRLMSDDESRSKPKVHGSLSGSRKKELMGQIIQKIESSPIDERQKSSMLLSIDNEFSEDENSILPANFKKGIIKKALENNDIQTLIQAVKDPENLPAAHAKLALKALSEPEKLDSDQLVSLLKVASRPDVSLHTVSSAFDNLQERKNAAQASGDVAAATMMDSRIVQAAKQGLASKAYNSDTIEKQNYYASTLLRYASTRDAVGDDAAKSLIKAIGPANVGTDLSADIFAALPLDLPDSVAGELNLDQLQGSIVNNPSFIRSAISGWKLEALVHRADAIYDPELIDTATRRVIGENDLNQEQKKMFAMRIAMNEFAADENVIAAARASGENGPFDVAKGLLKIGQSKSSKANKAAALLPVMNSEIGNTLKTEPYNSERLTYRLSTMASLLGSRMASHNQGTVNEATATFSTHLGKAFTNTLIEVQSGKLTETELHERALLYREAALDLSVMDNKISKENVSNVLEMSTYNDRLAEAVKSQYGQDVSLEGIKLGDDSTAKIMEGVASKAEFDKDEWTSAVRIQPLIGVALGSMPEIHGYMVDSLNMEDLGEEGPKLVGDWIEKIVDKDKATSVPKILSYATAKAVNGQGSKQYFQRTVEKAIQYAPKHVTPEFLRSIGSVLESPQAHSLVIDEAIKHGAGGEDFVRTSISNQLEETMDHKPSAQTIEACSRSPYVTSEQVGKILSMGNFSVDALAENKHLDRKSVSQVIDAALEKSGDSIHSSILNNLIQLPNISKDDFMKLGVKVDMDDQRSKRAYFNNPKWGGEAFRNLPVAIPAETPGIKRNDLVVTKADYSAPRERLNKLLSIVPPGGMDWVTFKRANKDMENLPEVKSLFMSKPGNVVKPEDVVEAMKTNDDPFNVTYSKWEGAQRHTDADNLVVQLNLSEKMEKDIAEDPARWEFYTALVNSMGGHPITPRIASWARVDTQGGNKGWVIEEFQSDFGPRLEDWLPRMCDNGSMELAGKSVSESQLKEYAKFITNRIKNWHMASMKAVEDLARKQGVKELFIHGEGVRAKLSGFDSSKENPVQIKEMYNKTPKKLGWEKADYTDYPVQDKGFYDDLVRNNRETYAWRKKLG